MFSINLLCFSQINIDSLYNIISTSDKYKKCETRIYLLNEYKSFSDNVSIYSFFIDSTGTLSEDLKLSCLYQKYDTLNRLVEITGYSKDGELSYYDYSPHSTIDYKKDSIIETFYDYYKKYSHKKIVIKDSLGRCIQKLEFDENYKNTFNEKRVYEGDTLLTIINLSSDGKLLPNINGATFIIQKFNSFGIIEESYYDSNRNLIDSDYHNLGSDYFKVKYSTIKRVTNGRFNNWVYYNSNGEVECEKDESTGEIIKITYGNTK